MIKAMMFALIAKCSTVNLAIVLVHGRNVGSHVLTHHAEGHDCCHHPLQREAYHHDDNQHKFT